MLGLAEVMDYVSVAEGQEDMLQKLLDAKRHGKRIDGHLAGLSSDIINIYRTAMVSNDHEVTTKEEALDRIRRGCMSCCAKDRWQKIRSMCCRR